MRLLLVRHGQTPSNLLHLLDSAVPGPGLTPLGEQQARDLVGRLAGQRVDAVWASSMARAQLTAAPLAAARGLAVGVLHGLRELSAGDWEGRSDDASVQEYLRVAMAWGDGDPDAAVPGAPGGRAALAEYDAAVAQVAADLAGRGDGAAAVVVSHGASLRAWASARALGLPPRWAADHPLPNTAVVVLDGDPGAGWRATSWADEPLGVPTDAASTAAPAGPGGEPTR